MTELKTYQFDEYSTIATVGTLEEAIKWYENETGEKVDREEIAEIDPDKTTMFYEVDSNKYRQETIIPINEAHRGDFISYGDGICECITLTEAHKRNGEPEKPYEICSTEW